MVAQQREELVIDYPRLNDLENTVDLRLLVQDRLGNPKGHGSKAWSFQCPFHRGSKASFTVWANGWKCWADCNESGGVITFLRRYDNLSFVDAIRAIGGDPAEIIQNYRPTPGAPYVRQAIPFRRPEPKPAPIAEPPTDAYQQAAMDIVTRACKYLWSADGLPGFTYLHNERGLYMHTIARARLGYIPPSDDGSWWTVNGLKFPGNAITIPWIADGYLWGIKMRWLDGKDDKRYRQPKTVGPDLDPNVDKSNLDGSLYGADDILPGWPVMVIEGEFNRLIADQEGRDIVCAVSPGTAGQGLNPRWFAHLATAPKLLALFDADKAGQRGAEKLSELTHRTKSIALPEGIKDLNDFHLICRDAQQLRGVTDWIESAVDHA